MTRVGLLVSWCFQPSQSTTMDYIRAKNELQSTSLHTSHLTVTTICLEQQLTTICLEQQLKYFT